MTNDLIDGKPRTFMVLAPGMTYYQPGGWRRGADPEPTRWLRCKKCKSISTFQTFRSKPSAERVARKLARIIGYAEVAWRVTTPDGKCMEEYISWGEIP